MFMIKRAKIKMSKKITNNCPNGDNYYSHVSIYHPVFLQHRNALTKIGL